MKLYSCTDHDQHYPVGCASVVIAPDEDAARLLLDAALTTSGLRGFADERYTLQEIAIEPGAYVLWDGNY